MSVKCGKGTWPGYIDEVSGPMDLTVHILEDAKRGFGSCMLMETKINGKVYGLSLIAPTNSDYQAGCRPPEFKHWGDPILKSTYDSHLWSIVRNNIAKFARMDSCGMYPTLPVGDIKLAYESK